MKVYIITPTTFPMGLADTNRIIYYAKMLKEKGVEAEVLIYKRNNQYNNKESQGVFEGIPFKYVGGECYRPNSTWKARLYDCYDRYALFQYLRRNLKKNDIVFCYGSLYTSLIPLITHIKKAKFVFNLCELPHVVENESWKSRMLRDLFGKLVLRNSDAVVSITKALTQYARKYVGESLPILEIPILVDHAKYNMEDKSQESNQIYIFHAGSLSESKDGFLGMVEAFGLASLELRKNFVFYSTGNINKCPHREELEDLIRRYSLDDKLIFTGYLTDEQLRDYLCKASMVIINKYRSLQNQYCFSSKLAEYMAASKAIIMTDVSESRDWLKTGYDCMMIEPENTKELTRAIKNLYEQPQLRMTLGRNANLSCKEMFDYHVYSTKLTDFFVKLI